MNLIRIRCAVDSQAPLAAAGPLNVVADVVAPDRIAGSVSRLAFCCIPGGAMRRGYFDLMVGEDTSYSFAEAMAAHGHVSVLIDSLGVGEGGRPLDGYELTPDVMADANERAVAHILNGLRRGDLDPALPPMTALKSIGVGHSMGALLTAVQQARHRSHVAVLLLGYSTRGMADFNSAEENAYADDPAGARANAVRLARIRHPEPYFEIVSNPTSREVFGRGADRPAVMALATVREKCLATPSLFSMIPASSAPDCAAVDVPVMLAIGDRDICGPPHEVPASFPASRDITLLVLAETGHTHFVFPSRQELFDRVARWAATVTRRDSH
jgi:pimeloyl-ACP methyl ester carboxylesterase